jgi:Protein of unknown function (DUF1553)/Protein of unknown function (DUF1549)/Planctomycete cytochrome C
VFRFPASLVLLALVASHAPGQTTASDGDTFFELKIRPVLVERCFKCHGGDKVSHGLRVGSRAALLKGGESGPALVPGRAEESLLVRALRHRDDDLRMPPSGKLPETVIADFVAWVNRGAPWPAGGPTKPDAFVAKRHWAFVPVLAVELPADPSGWSNHPVDRFLAAGWRGHGLAPVGPADKRALLRRLTFDLTGLPPTPEEMATFLADSSLQAYDRVVERLLASPHYGERWGRHWLDLVRYADTAGDNADYPVPEAARYRDYVIDAFNADKPYDQFLQEQLAGDLLASHGPREECAQRVVATTYLGLARRYLTAPYEHWHLTLEDVLDTTGRAFLGLTLRCARCHDHKYDPATTEDYYALYGIFASTQFPYAGSEEFASMKRPREAFVPLVPPDEAAPQLELHRQRLQQLRAAIAFAEKNRASDPNLQKQLQPLREQLRVLERTNLPPDLPGAYAVSEGQPMDVPVQRGGDPDRPGPVVRRGVPRFLAGGEPFVIAPRASGRLELARWLTSPQNPLTARVMVNRIWQYHFGKGLVATPSNFGLRGEPPSHPELLDYLAARFVASGWSVKAMHRLIVSSKAYQLASHENPDNAVRDPGNRWYWRFDRRRLDAEALRDAMLAVGGNLDPRRPGPHPFPPIGAWGWTQHAPFKDVYPSNHRSVYLMTQRLQRHPYLALFDGPDPNTTTDVRTSSTVPLQALYLLNNPFVQEQAQGLTRRLLAAGPSPRERIAHGYELAWGRPPTPNDEIEARQYVERYGRELATLGVPPADREREAWAGLARVLLTANEFIYLD